MVRDVYFNCIYVIQSLPEDETQTGTNLYNDLLRWRTDGHEVLRSELLDVGSAHELYATLERLAILFYEEQVIPYIHFEIHGCQSGLVLKNRDLVKWKDLRPYLSAINYNIHNNLFISLATCYGAYILHAVDMLERIPFYAFIGPAEEVKEGEIEADWSEYFDVLLKGKDFTEAIISLNNTNKRVLYVFYTAEQIFDKYKQAYLASCTTRRQKRERIASIRKKALADPNIKGKYTRHELETFFKNYAASLPGFVDEVKEYFMLKTDEFPKLF